MLKLGRLPRLRSPRVPHLSALLAGQTLPAPPPAVDWTRPLSGLRHLREGIELFRRMLEAREPRDEFSRFLGRQEHGRSSTCCIQGQPHIGSPVCWCSVIRPQ